MSNTSLARRLRGVLLSGSLLSYAAMAQSPPASAPSELPAPAQFDPSDLYLQGYLSTRAAEKLTAEGDHIGAAEKYRKAEEFFATVTKYYPEWRSEMVQRRSVKTSEALADANKKAEEQLDERRNVVAELEGGDRAAVEITPFDNNPNILKVDPVATRRLKEAESEVQRLRLLLEQQRSDTDRLRQDQLNGTSIAARQLHELQLRSEQELAAARAEIQRLRTHAAMQSDSNNESKQLADLLRAEQIKVARLQREAESLREQTARLNLRDEDLSARQLAEARAEVRRLKREATMAQIQAEAEIKRLQRITGEMEADSRQKIGQFEDLAKSADEHARKEEAKLETLKGAQRDQAEMDVKRLKDIAAKAKADAQKELAQLKRRADQQNSEAQTQIEKLRELALNASKEAEAKELEFELSQSRNQIKIKELEQNNSQLQLEREKTEAKLQAAEADVHRLKARLAKAPLESEVDTLNLRIKQLEQEREAMAMSLQQSQNGYAQAMGRIAGLEKDLLEARQKSVDLNRDLIAERDAANAVVAGQRRQLEQMQKLLDEKSAALTDANKQITQLHLELAQSKEAYEQLRNERDELMMERDQMAALLKLSEAGRIQDLVDQNMGLAKKLREANEALERMQRESDSDKDAITDALRDLAIAKSQINRLRDERQKQEERIQDLEQRLRDEGKALAQGETSADPQEAAMLRDIILRQQRALTARRQSRDLLMDALKKLGSEDEQLSQAVAMLDDDQIALTPEEQKLVADRQVDGEFISPFARDRGSVDEATAGLKRDIDVFDRAAKKAFISGRLHPTRELYEMILEQHPGHTPTLCKMGVVQLKLGHPDEAAESFQRAIELDGASAYTMRMLSYSLMREERILDAESAARKSVELDPNDAKNHMLLATLCYRLGKAGDAESHFKGAISADPLSSEPYYNLALIYSGTGRIEQAQQYYRQALERGALPDPELEQELAAQ